MWNLLQSLTPRRLAVGGVPSGMQQPLGEIQKMTAKVSADAQDTKIKDQAGLDKLQEQLNATISTKDFSNLSAEVRGELKLARKILADIETAGGKVTPQQVADLKLLSEKILVGITPADTEVKWGTLNVKIKDDDTRYKDMKTNKSIYLLPEGGISKGGVTVNQFSDKSPVPTLKTAIYDDFAAVRGKCKNPQELQTVIENGFGKKLSAEDAQALFDFIEKGAIGGSDKVTKEDVGKLQKILGSISPHFEQRLAKNGSYDSKYGYATTEEVRLLAAQMAKTNDPGVPPWVPKKDAVYVVDNSGSMTEKTKAMYKLIDKYQKQPDGTTVNNQVASFSSGESEMFVKGKMTQASQQGIDGAMNAAFMKLVGPKPRCGDPNDPKVVADYTQRAMAYNEKVADFAKLLNVRPSQITNCLDANGNLKGEPFRLLMDDAFKDNQESGLKAAIVTMMLNPAGTQGRDMYICADEPEHEPQYLNLVKKLAEVQNINITVVAMPTEGPLTEKNMKFIPLDNVSSDMVKKNLVQGEYKWTTGQKTAG